VLPGATFVKPRDKLNKPSVHYLLDKFFKIMHIKHMVKKDALCKPLPMPKRHRITVALSNDLWGKFQPALKNKWGDSFTSWLEYAMECYSRDTCRGCPYESDEEQEKAVDGIGKIVDNGIE
jgi:hypothetical protein